MKSDMEIFAQALAEGLSLKDAALRVIADDEKKNPGTWYKCANCGQRYPLGFLGDDDDPDYEDWRDTTVCSPGCRSKYLAYIKESNRR